MAIYTRHHIDFVAATDGTGYINKTFDRSSRTTNEVERSENLACYQQTVVITGTVGGTTKTFNLSSALGTQDVDLGLIRMIYIESSGPVTVSLLDDDAAVNEIVSLVLAGPSGSGACKLFAEIESFIVADGDTLVLTNPSDAIDITVTFCLIGTTVVEP
jgi:hypothetical protein